MESFISFPKLGIHFNIDSVAFEILGKEIYWYGIIIAFGFMLAVCVGYILANKYGMNPDTITDIVIFGAPIAIVCARIYYVIFEWEHYSLNPQDIIKIWNGGIAIYGAVIGAVLVAVIYCRVKKENFGLLSDIGAIGLTIGQSIGRWGNFVNQEAFGGNTNLPWGMTGDKISSYLYSLQAEGIKVNPNLPVHPTFLYESLWNLTFLVFALLFFKKRKFDGQIFFLYLISYGVGRFIIEGLRTDSLYIGVFRVSQIVALICIIAGVAFIVHNFRKSNRKLTLPVDKNSVN